MKNGNRIGKQFERDMARHLTMEALGVRSLWLLEHVPLGDHKIVTSRSVGAHTEEDLVLRYGPSRHHWDRLPVSIELKAEAQFRPQPWLEQAKRQSADGRPYVVIWKARNRTLDRSWVIMPWDGGRWVMTWLSHWLDVQARYATDLSPEGLEGVLA